MAKINVFKGDFSKNNEGANVHPCNSFRGKCPHMPIFIGVQMSVGAYVRTPLCSHSLFNGLNEFTFQLKRATVNVVFLFVKGIYTPRFQRIGSSGANHYQQSKIIISTSYIYT